MSSQLKPGLIVYGFSASVSAAFYSGQLACLRRAGYEVAIIASPGPEAESLARQEGAAFFPVPIAREISPMRDLLSLFRIYRLLRRLRPVLTNFGTPKAGLLGGLAAAAARVPCRIYSLHGLRMETATGVKRAILWCTEWLASRSAQVTLCVSESLRRKAGELGLVRPQAAVVLGKGSCNGVDSVRYGQVNQEIRNKLRGELSLPCSTPVIGFVGRFVRDKGIAELVQAFQTLSAGRPSLHLLLVGDFEDGDPVSPAVRQAIESDPKIVMTGFVKDTAPYYHLMDILALPTYREGLPGTSLEAQSAGVPVVTTRATGTVDSIVDGVTGLLVPVGEAPALASAMEKLLQDPLTRTRMGDAGRERARRDFAPEVIWQALLNLYDKLLENHLHGVSVLPRQFESRAGAAARVPTNPAA